MKYLQGVGYDVVAISAPGPHVRWLEENGIRHIAVPMRRAFTPADDLRAVFDLARVMRRERLTIVHTHNAKPGLLGQLAARLAGVPIVVNTIHGFYFQEDTPALKRRFYIMMEQIAASCSDAILSQSAEDLETAIAVGICSREEISHLGNGIDLTRFSPGANSSARGHIRKELGLGDDDLVVGFAGRMVAEKGILDLWEAMRLLETRNVTARLLVVGETDTEKPDALSPANARAAGVEHLCIFTGWRDDLPRLMMAMDVFALPSHREGFPRTLMEASAMGLPIVATDIRGCREAVLPGINGVLVAARNPVALAGAIEGLISNRALRARLREGGQRLAHERFDEQRQFRIVEATYRRLLASTKGESPLC